MYTEERLQEKFESLPDDVKGAITSTNIDEVLQEIGQKYKIHLDKLEDLSDETGLVMLGLTHPKNYLSHLKGRLEIPEDLAREMVAEVNEKIFKPIKDSLLKIHNIEENDVDEENPLLRPVALSYASPAKVGEEKDGETPREIPEI